MRKYLATLFGVAIGIATAVFVAAHADDDATSAATRREGSA